MGAAEWINFCIAIITALVCVANFRLLRETRRTSAIMEAQIAASTRPYIQIGATIRRDAPVIMLVISNSGNSAARNLKLTIDQHFYRSAEKQDGNNLRNLVAFKETTASFGPKMELRFMLGAGHTVLGNPELCPPRFTVQAEYSHVNEKFLERTVIDLAPFAKSDGTGDPITSRLDRIGKAVEEVAVAIKQLPTT